MNTSLSMSTGVWKVNRIRVLTLWDLRRTLSFRGPSSQIPVLDTRSVKQSSFTRVNLTAEP